MGSYRDPNTGLTDAEAIEIMAAYYRGENRLNIAERRGVHFGTVKNITEGVGPYYDQSRRCNLAAMQAARGAA